MKKQDIYKVRVNATVKISVAGVDIGQIDVKQLTAYET